MSRGSFPNLLSKQARPLGGLTRTQLSILGGSYLLLSHVGVSGFTSLVSNIILLLTLKIVEKKFRPGFFRHLTAPKVLPWAYKVEASP